MATGLKNTFNPTVHLAGLYKHKRTKGIVKEHLNHYYLRVSLIEPHLYVTVLTHCDDVICGINYPCTIQNPDQT